MTAPVRVRFAPSPTGHLHIGGARTALYNWAFARHMGGTFILRIDDTDAERSTDENTGQILRSLRWLGLTWDEGPEAGGESGPYYQTARGDLYASALESLKASGHAYPCFCSAEELAAKRDASRASVGCSGYDRTCRALDPAKAARRIEAGEPHVWRVAVPLDRSDIIVDDVIRGQVPFSAEAMDDLILVRTDGTPTYNFATVVDDWKMGITHVIRGDDHLSNTPRQIVIFEALGARPPKYGHLSMILGSDGKRLSKRHGATSVDAYQAEGILPEALLNYLALLGWALDDKTTIFDARTLVENFDVTRVSRNPAIWDPDKLEWMNGYYIRDLSPGAFADRIAPLLVDAALLTPAEVDERRPWLEALQPLVSERLKRLDQLAPMVSFLFSDDIAIDPAAAEKTLAQEGAALMLAAAADALADLAEWSAEHIEHALRQLPEALGMKPKAVFQVVRVATTGSTVSPPLFESLALLGRERTLRRLEVAKG